MLPCRLREFSPARQNLCETRNHYECHPESRANARAKDPDAPSCSHAASGNFHQNVRTSVKLEPRSPKLSFFTSSCKSQSLVNAFATVVCCNSLNLSQIDIQPFGGFAPRTMSFYKYGRKKFFLPYGVAFGPFGSRRSWTISGDWNLLLVSIQLTPLHGSERP